MPTDPKHLKELQDALGLFGFGLLRLMWCVTRGDPSIPACQLEKAAFARFLASKAFAQAQAQVASTLAHSPTAKVCHYCYVTSKTVSRLVNGKCPICQPAG